jgi:hypothetical protein
MNYGLLVRKLNLVKKKYLTSNEIKEYCKIIEMPYYDAIIYLTRHKHLYTLLRGIFYKPGIEERKMKKISVNHLEALAEALKLKGITNWYLGLESALKINNATHEFFTVDVIINDKIYRKKPVYILGNKIRFIKIKSSLAKIGVEKSGILRFSDIEKTVLDSIYLSKYTGLNDEEIKNKISPLIKFCAKKKLSEYSSYYNTTTKKLLDEI